MSSPVTVRLGDNLSPNLRGKWRICKVCSVTLKDLSGII